MENITIGQLYNFILFIGGFIGAVIVLLKYLDKWFKNKLKPILNEELGSIKQDVSIIKKDIKEVDMNATKNYLSKCFNDLRKGQEISEANKQRIYEQMEHYTKMGGNSYIHKEFEDLKKEGLL